MKLYPAIDLYGGKAVRLLRGDYAQMTVYDDNPAALACKFRECGAENIHLVDLEGARSGGTPNLDVIQGIVRAAGLFCEVGGGIRDFSVIEAYLSAGVSRVILGTAAVTESGFVSEAVKRYGADRIAVGVDIRDCYVAIRGWTEKSGLTYSDFLSRLLADGVTTVICTDISRDGAMQGVHLGLYREISENYPSLSVIASGGVSSLDDIRALAGIGVSGAVIGKAYYTGAIDLREALEAAK